MSLPYNLERGNGSIKVAAALLLALVVLCMIYMAFLLGQADIAIQCKSATFFKVGNDNFECMPYTEGMLK